MRGKGTRRKLAGRVRRAGQSCSKSTCVCLTHELDGLSSPGLQGTRLKFTKVPHLVQGVGSNCLGGQL